MNSTLRRNYVVFRTYPIVHGSILDCSRRLQTVVATAIRSNLQPSHWSVVPRCRIGWLPPRLGCVKLNNDGIFRSSDVHASCVRVIRNSLSAWCHECLG
ncbi:hypothetical protein V6N11_058073 [Hibiscus sabdariffa]|uniref:Uncharacterized protein n=1 Tax=Hibiscus sabdariffa TaxID=183260 RepID=A0ABR2N7Y8_9ROSI